jgi:hypothetical protein
MAVVSHHGVHKPFYPTEDYSLFGSRTPALHGFRLTHLGSDHQVVDVGVLAGGNSVDLSPNADPNFLAASVPDGELDVQLQDASASGDDFGYYVAHSTLTVPGARRFQIRDVGCVSACKRTIPSQAFGGRLSPPAIGGYLLALAGFRLFFTGNRNHELDRIGVWFEGHDIHVALRDQSGNDTFAYLVDFVVIPKLGLNIATGAERGTGAKALDTYALPTPRRSHFLLTGWALNFQNGDHEILDIGVVGSDNGFSVFYGDSGGDEPFDWRVEWAHVGPVVLAPT